MASSASANNLRFLCTTAKPARKAANTRLTCNAPATAQYASNTAIAYPTGEFFATTLNRALLIFFMIRGTIVRPSTKNAMVAIR